MTWYVYALCEPSDGKIRYVGKSKNPAQRLEAHRSKSASSANVRSWIESLGGDPQLEILQELPDETAALVAEQKTIARLRASGVKLLNALRAASGASTQRRARFSGFGDRVLARRLELNIGQNELGELVEFSQGGLSRIECGHRPYVSAETAVLLARALDVSVEWLVTGEERAKKASAA